MIESIQSETLNMSTVFQKRDQLESQIVDLLQQGDQRAISIIYSNYADTLLGMISRIVPTETIAEEVLQDTFIKIWKNASQYNPQKGRLFTWFANIARNTAIDKLRSAGYKKQQKTDSTETIVNSSELGIDEVNIKDSGLANVINSLDEKYRTLIDLAYFQGYSQREIEKELNIPLGTIKTRLRLAIQELRAKLDNDMVQKLLFVVLILTYLFTYFNSYTEWI